MPDKSCSGSEGDGFWGGSWEMGGTGGLGYRCCRLVCPRGCTLLPLSAAPVGVSHTAILVSTIGLGPPPLWPMLTVDNFVSWLVSFISHLGALPGSWTVTTLLALSQLLSLQGSGCRRCSSFFTWACRLSHHTLTYVGKVYFISTDDVQEETLRPRPPSRGFSCLPPVSLSYPVSVLSYLSMCLCAHMECL